MLELLLRGGMKIPWGYTSLEVGVSTDLSGSEPATLIMTDSNEAN